MKHIKVKIGLTFMFVLIITYYHIPRIVLTSSKTTVLSYTYVMNYKNGYDLNGEPTLKQMEELLHGVQINSVLKKRDYIIFPIFFTKEISSISIGGNIYNCPDDLFYNKSELSKMIKNGNLDIIYENNTPLIIYTEDLYFFRIYAEFTENASFEKIYIQKYPWSKKLEYNIKLSS
ncbi:MAG: hypothetical protein IJ530_13175 [Treponema sp.]|uniref:hypothetical protein n=1 Tax=Treponema sp. TaxID=166 RepID=UPI0025FAC693|nr:hypothetical protein [Treponema sp.]MBQ8680686.1 hypothetical protein [Treponema sp.]